MKLRDNKWGFDLALDNPFRIFRVLRRIADESVGETNVIDLSRGDPGYGFCPSMRGREIYAFLLEVDRLVNSPDELFVTDNNDDWPTLWQRISDYANSIYSQKKAESLLKGFEEFLEILSQTSIKQDLNFDKEKVFFEIFKYSMISGGAYLIPQGEPVVRAYIAEHYNRTLDLGVDYSDLILVQGISHGIATAFKVLCDERIGYLKPGDTVVISSPVYAPYNTIMENRGLKVFAIPIDPTSGKVEGDIDEILASAPENVKLVCMIDPNNPIGFPAEDTYLEKLANFAKEKNAIIVSDEVYTDFFPQRKRAMMHFAPERTIMIGGRSKIERSTGLRFGEYIIKKEAQKYIAENILCGNLDIARDLMEMLIFAKAPGGIRGEFQHVTFVTGPSQFMGVAHMIFGTKDRDEYLKRIHKNMESFYDILGMNYAGNLYYTCFNLNDIEGNVRRDLEPEQLFIDLAKRGVVLLPTNLFFPEEERKKKDCRAFARAAVPNVSHSYLVQAATVIKNYITGKE